MGHLASPTRFCTNTFEDQGGRPTTYYLNELSFSTYIIHTTVDGRNPAPPGMYKTLLGQTDKVHINWCRISSINNSNLVLVWILRIFFFSRIMMDSLKVIILFCAHWCLPFRFSAHHFPHQLPPRKLAAPDFQPMHPRDSRETTLEVPEEQEPGGPRGWRNLRVQIFVDPKNRWPWKGKDDEGWIWCFTFVFFKGNIAGGGLKIYSGWQCCWMFVWEGSIVKMAKYDFSGCMKERPGKACVIVVHVWTWKDTSWYSIMTYRLWSLQGLIKYDTMYIT